jgi:hypothetical protein
LKVRLLFVDSAGTLLGGQIAGNISVGELINTIAKTFHCHLVGKLIGQL